MNAMKVIKLHDSGSTPPPRRHRPIKTLEDVRRELSKLYREARNNSIDIADASRLANILSLAGRVIEGSTVEARIKALESQRNG